MKQLRMQIEELLQNLEVFFCWQQQISSSRAASWLQQSFFNCFCFLQRLLTL